MAANSKKTTRTPRATKSRTSKSVRNNVAPVPAFESKTTHVIQMLRRKDGASIAEIMQAIGWKEPSVRALLTATIAKGHKLPLVKGRAPGEATRYYVAAIRPTKQ
jgi:hypothetical protein